MGIIDNLKRLARGGTSRPGASVPALDSASGLSKASADFTAGSDGDRQRSIWARFKVPFNLASGSVSSYGNGGYQARQDNQAQATATALSTSNSTVATLILNSTTLAVGTGLTLSSRLDAEALGITPADAKVLSSQIEKAWKRYAENPIEVDASGRFDLHQNIAAAYDQWMRCGEVLIAVEWRKVPGARLQTKLRFLDPNLIDRTKTITGPGPNEYTFRGIVFDNVGRVKGYMLYDAVLGHPLRNPISKFVTAKTSWGRTKLFYHFVPTDPAQVRGVTPLAATLTPAQAKDTLSEFVLDAALVQSQTAVSLESELPPNVALAALRTDNGFASEGPNGGAAGGIDPLDMRAAWYSENKISLHSGTVTALPVGDKLRFHRVEAPHAYYDSFNRSITRDAAKAGGSSFEELSGDYSQTSFSASRLALELPHRITMRRRKDVVEAMYKMVLACVLEEMFETGMIKLPKSALPFYAARDLYCECKFLGEGRTIADPLKAAQADVLKIENNLATRAEVLAERGIDWDTHVIALKAEKEDLQAAGLWVEPKPAGAAAPLPEDNERDDQPQPLASRGNQR